LCCIAYFRLDNAPVVYTWLKIVAQPTKSLSYYSVCNFDSGKVHTKNYVDTNYDNEKCSNGSTRDGGAGKPARSAASLMAARCGEPSGCNLESSLISIGYFMIRCTGLSSEPWGVASSDHRATLASAHPVTCATGADRGQHAPFNRASAPDRPQRGCVVQLCVAKSTKHTGIGEGAALARWKRETGCTPLNAENPKETQPCYPAC
jgi:hypothetical protein